MYLEALKQEERFDLCFLKLKEKKEGRFQEAVLRVFRG